MYSTVISGGIRGIYSYLVQVEVDTAQGLPGFEMVGYLGSEVKEAKERVRVAMKNAGYVMPAGKITVNISPADIENAISGIKGMGETKVKAVMQRIYKLYEEAAK